MAQHGPQAFPVAHHVQEESRSVIVAQLKLLYRPCLLASPSSSRSRVVRLNNISNRAHRLLQSMFKRRRGQNEPCLSFAYGGDRLNVGSRLSILAPWHSSTSKGLLDVNGHRVRDQQQMPPVQIAR